MRSVKRRFNQIRRRFPYWSSYLCFAEAIKDQGFSNRVVHYWFNRLVSRDDFSEEERLKILRHLKNVRPP